MSVASGALSCQRCEQSEAEHPSSFGFGKTTCLVVVCSTCPKDAKHVIMSAVATIVFIGVFCTLACKSRTGGPVAQVRERSVRANLGTASSNLIEVTSAHAHWTEAVPPDAGVPLYHVQLLSPPAELQRSRHIRPLCSLPGRYAAAIRHPDVRLRRDARACPSADE